MISAEEIARREFDIITNPNTVKVKIGVKQVGSFWLPEKESKTILHATFKTFSYGDHLIIQKACSYDVPCPDPFFSSQAIDFYESRRILLKRNLLSWDIPIEIQRDGGWMTSECYKRVSKLPAPLIEGIIDAYEDKANITKEEEDEALRQSAVLFAKNSRGVIGACEAVSLYCTLSSYWEKFGLDKENINNLPYREYQMLRIMVSKQSEADRINNAPKPSNTKISYGGKTMASRGVVQPGQ